MGIYPADYPFEGGENTKYEAVPLYWEDRNCSKRFKGKSKYNAYSNTCTTPDNEENNLKDFTISTDYQFVQENDYLPRPLDAEEGMCWAYRNARGKCDERLGGVGRVRARERRDGGLAADVDPVLRGSVLPGVYFLELVLEGLRGEGDGAVRDEVPPGLRVRVDVVGKIKGKCEPRSGTFGNKRVFSFKVSKNWPVGYLQTQVCTSAVLCWHGFPVCALDNSGNFLGWYAKKALNAEQSIRCSTRSP